MDSTCELGGLVCPSPLTASPASACLRHADSFEVLSGVSPNANKLALGVDDDVFVYALSPLAIWLLKKGVAYPDVVRTVPISLTGLAFNPRTGDLITCSLSQITLYKDNGHATITTASGLTSNTGRQCALSQNGMLFVATTAGVYQWNPLTPLTAAAAFWTGISVEDVVVMGAFVYALENRPTGARVFQLQLSDGALVATHCCFYSALSIQVNNRGEIFVLSKIPSLTGTEVSLIDLDGVVSSYASLPTLVHANGDGLLMPNGDFLIAHQSTGRVLRIPPPLPKPVLQTCLHSFDVSKFPSIVAAGPSLFHLPVRISGAPVGGSVTLSIMCDHASPQVIGSISPVELVWTAGDDSIKVFTYQLIYNFLQQPAPYTCWFTIGTATTNREKQ
jgi:hypothetical protein